MCLDIGASTGGFFEVGKGQVGKGGIVRDPAQQQESVARVSRKLLKLGFSQLASLESSLPGAEGNREFFLHAVWRKTGDMPESVF